MRNNERVPHEIDKPSECGVWIGRIGNILFMNIREMRHFIRYFFTWIYEGDVPFDDLSIAHAGSRDLDELVMVEGKARGFRIEYYYICIERAEGMRLGIFFQMRITLTDACRSVFENICFKR